eukprot:COSAG01_NODE_2146_length_8303_cov_24.698684_1_plen_133_part_10
MARKPDDGKAKDPAQIEAASCALQKLGQQISNGHDCGRCDSSLGDRGRYYGPGHNDLSRQTNIGLGATPVVEPTQQPGRPEREASSSHPARRRIEITGHLPAGRRSSLVAPGPAQWKCVGPIGVSGGGASPPP